MQHARDGDSYSPSHRWPSLSIRMAGCGGRVLPQTMSCCFLTPNNVITKLPIANSTRMVRLFGLGVLLSLMAPTDALAQKKIPKAQGHDQCPKGNGSRSFQQSAAPKLMVPDRPTTQSMLWQGQHSHSRSVKRTNDQARASSP